MLLAAALVPLADRFNAWSRADPIKLDVKTDHAKSGGRLREPQLLLLFGTGLLGAMLADQVGQWLGGDGFFTVSVVRILAVTALGLLLAYTPLSRLYGSETLANALLYLMVATIASRTSFADLASAPIYLVAGVVILLVHAGFMLVAARPAASGFVHLRNRVASQHRRCSIGANSRSGLFTAVGACWSVNGVVGLRGRHGRRAIGGQGADVAGRRRPVRVSGYRLAMLRAPLRLPFKTALRQVDEVEDVVVLLESDCGKLGYGSAPATRAITGAGSPEHNDFTGTRPASRS